MRRFRPIFNLDPGWFFVLAALMMVAAALLLPARRQLEDLSRKEQELREHEAFAFRRLSAYSEFLSAIDSHDETLIRRLAAAQLNLIPSGEQAVMLASTIDQPVTAWIDATVQMPPSVQVVESDSRIQRLVESEWRPWVLAGSVLSLFVGLLVHPEKDSVREIKEAGTDQVSTVPSLTRSAANR